MNEADDNDNDHNDQPLVTPNPRAALLASVDGSGNDISTRSTSPPPRPSSRQLAEILSEVSARHFQRLFVFFFACWLVDHRFYRLYSFHIFFICCCCCFKILFCVTVVLSRLVLLIVEFCFFGSAEWFRDSGRAPDYFHCSKHSQCWPSIVCSWQKNWNVPFVVSLSVGIFFYCERFPNNNKKKKKRFSRSFQRAENDWLFSYILSSLYRINVDSFRFVRRWWFIALFTKK
jgi:hypothetical protein